MNQKNLIGKSCKDAVNEIHTGDTIWIGDTRGVAAEFLEELLARAGDLRNITVIATACSKETTDTKKLREADNLRFLSFSPEVLLQTCSHFGPRFLTADSEKIISLVCECFGVNVVVLPVCVPDKNGICALAGNMAQFEGYVSAYPGVTKHIALIDPDAAPAYGASWTQLSKSLFFTFYGEACGHELLKLTA